jgi:hypothetical protein
MNFQKSLYMEVSKVSKSLLDTLDTAYYAHIQKINGSVVGKWLDDERTGPPRKIILVNVQGPKCLKYPKVEIPQ